MEIYVELNSATYIHQILECTPLSSNRHPVEILCIPIPTSLLVPSDNLVQPTAPITNLVPTLHDGSRIPAFAHGARCRVAHTCLIDFAVAHFPLKSWRRRSISAMASRNKVAALRSSYFSYRRIALFRSSIMSITNLPSHATAREK